MAALVGGIRRRRQRIVTSSGCVAQAWRDGARQAELARLLRSVTEEPLDPRSSRPVGQLCAVTGTADVVDAHLALLARDSDIVMTSDPRDLTNLLASAGCSASVVPC